MRHQINTTQVGQADRFTFTNTNTGDINIVFLPQILRGNRRIPQLDYRGEEGQFTFRGEEVKQQQSSLGLLISVTLKPKADGTLDFALVLSSINLEGQKFQDFETVAIATTRNRKIVANHTGMEFTYKILTLKGVAQKLPFVTPNSVPSEDWRNPNTPLQEDRYNLIDFPRF